MFRRTTSLLALAILLAAAAAAQPDRVQPTDLFHLAVLGEVALSPDGRQVAYTVRSIAPHPEREGRHVNRTHVWLAPMDGSREPRQVTSGPESASAPAWHPSGERLFFVRRVGDRPQVHVLPLDGGEAFPVTDLPHGAASAAVSGDGRRLLVTSTIPFAEVEAPGPPWPVERPGPAPPAGVEPDPDGSWAAVRAFLDRQPAEIAQVTTRLDFQGEQTLEPEPEFRHLFVVDVDDLRPGEIPAARRLTSGFTSYRDATWSADGRYVLAAIPADTTVHPDRVLSSRLVRIPDGGGPPEGLLALEGWTLGAPVPSPDGRHVAFTAARLDRLGYQQNQAGLIDLDTGRVSWLTEDLDRSAGDVRFAPDGRSVYLVAPTDGGFPLYRVNLEDAAITRLTALETGIRSYDVGPRGMAFVRTSIDNPYELYAAGEDASGPRALSRHNAGWLEGRALSRPAHRTLPRTIPLADGRVETFEMDYWVMEPVGRRPGERYPVLLQIHGGPAAMWGPGEATMWHEFQMFAARGFAVVYANPRGGGGYGFDFRYANFQDWGAGPASDVLAALDAAILEFDWIDPDRQVVTGGSYAGFLTAWIVAHTDRFRAAVAQRGVYDLRTFLGEGNAWRLVPHHFGGYPWEEEFSAIIEANSPINFVDQIQTPLLITHPSQDLRTGVSQSEMLYRSLKILGRPVEYVRFPGAGHDLSRTGDPDQRLDRILRIYEFLARHVAD